MLDDPCWSTLPFPYFHCARALGPETCAVLEQRFEADAEWQHRDADFYQCFLREITAELPGSLLQQLTARMRTILQLPLTDRVLVTAQRMEPGQRVGPHSDRPLVGYEIARLVLQLNRAWRPEYGGMLELFATADGPPVHRVAPLFDHAFGFVLHTDSHHAVTEVSRTRRSVVFNFWHPANTPPLADAVHALFSDARFSELPAAVDSVASQAEAHLPEESTLRAGMAAIALVRWGCADDVVVAGYRHAASLPSEAPLSAEDRASIALADWVARLHLDVFDLQAWRVLRDALAHTAPCEPAKPLWHLCVPPSADVTPLSG